MKLYELINGICDENIEEKFRNRDIQNVCCDSRKVSKGDLFVALKGPSCQGAAFIDEAIQKGASVVVINEEDTIQKFQEDVCFLAVENTHTFLRECALRVYGNPSSQINVVGITGTNGKTTVSYLLEFIFKHCGFSSGMIGTIAHKTGELVMESHNTTPGFLDVQQMLCSMVSNKLSHCIMEVSSHALDQGRVDNIHFSTAVFTNLTHEHLDYHISMEEYFQAKAKLFSHLSTDAISVINMDDIYGRQIKDLTTSQVVTYGINNEADVMAQDCQFSLQGSQCKIIYQNKSFDFKTSLVGKHNIYNILAAVSVCLSEHLDMEDIQKSIENFQQVPGRLEEVQTEKDFSIFIDYAHTDDALKNLLCSIKELKKNRIILVFGCGGNRDQSKREKMGRVASQFADISIVTSDNPRMEDPQTIIDQIVKGFDTNRFEVIVNREKAIKKAVSLALKDDIILVVGKGHEKYQVVGCEKIPFDESKVIKKILAQ